MQARSLTRSTPKTARRWIGSTAIGFLLLFVGFIQNLSGQEWIEIQSPSFLAISNANRKASQDFVRQLEQFQDAVGELLGFDRVTNVPLVVVIFRDDRSFTPYKFLVSGKPAEIGGFFQRGRDFDMIAVNVDRLNSNPAGIIFHEYVHRLTSYRQHPWPNWLNEGIAEFYASFELEVDQVTLGAPLEHHVELLRGQKLMPLKQLLAVDHDSPEYVHSDKRGIFYAQSWALVHYLMMAEKGAYRSQLIKYSELIDLGYEEQDAFFRSMDFDLGELESRLQDYVSQNAYFVSNYRLSRSDAERKLNTNSLREADSLAYLGDLLRVIGRGDDALDHYTRAIRIGDSSGRARRGLGILHWERENFAVAGRELQASEKLAPQDPLIPYYLTDIEIRALEDQSVDLPEEQVARLFQNLDNSIRARPGFVGLRRLFGELALLSGQRLADAVKHLDQALEQEPTDLRLRVTYVQVLMAVPDLVRAREELAILRQSKNPQVVSFSESVSRNLEQQLASVEPPAAHDPEISEEAAKCQPAFVDVRGAAFLEGLLQRVQCGPEEVVFVLSVDGVEHSFRDPDPRVPVVFSCGLETTQMTCGEMAVPARIYYRDLQQAGRRALAVELKP